VSSVLTGELGDSSPLLSFSRRRSLVAAVLVAGTLASLKPTSGGADEAITQQRADSAPLSSFETFLDRLMAAESGGRSHAKNPRSTALGPFQFINATFLDVARRHFAVEVAGLSDARILALRTDRDFSRRAAAAFSRDNISFLKERGLDPTFAHLRLAYLLGAGDAASILLAQQDTRVAHVLSAAVVRANPFMRDMSAADLLAKSERDVARERNQLAGTAPQPRMRPQPLTRPSEQRVASHHKLCSQKRTLCRKAVALQSKRKATAQIAARRSNGQVQ
jgi:hypothetical protein